uniref:C-type lectin domain-containing protein n=1 Tax=Timema bartmani TaxID=61472 RepID=A0A7R9F6J1_9NEOP|nr:unnamed protein product [Timema bartmani]
MQHDDRTIGEAVEIWLDLHDFFKNKNNSNDLNYFVKFFSTALTDDHLANFMGPRFQGKNLSEEQHLSAMEYAEAYHQDAVPDLIKYKAKSRLERWIGGIYNWETKHWVWGATGEDLVHQGFSRQNPNTDHKWHCIMMDPTNYYRWNAKSCVHKKHYICETPLKKVRKKGNKKLARKQKKNTNINKSRLAHGDFS